MKNNSRVKRHLAASTAMASVAAMTLVPVVASQSTSAQTSGITITAQLPYSQGKITAPTNSVLRSLTNQYEKDHPGVKVDWVLDAQSNLDQQNAILLTQASGGNADDIVWQQYGPSSLPPGILLNIRPYLEKPDPYVPGNKSWLSLYSPSVIPYMTSPNGQIQIVLGSSIETGFMYNKADFKKAGITNIPTTWAQFVVDLAKLQAAGFKYPLLFGWGLNDNPSWWERLAGSELLQNELPKFDVDREVVTSGLDTAVGIERGVLSMKNSAYAEIWKLLGQLRPFMDPSGSEYDIGASLNSASPPFSTLTPFVQGKTPIIWGGSWKEPVLNSLGFAGKYGIFPEPTITTTTSKYSANLSTRGVIGGPNGFPEWSVTTAKADHTMTPAKTKVVMNFLAWLYTPAHLGAIVKNEGDGALIPVEPAAPTGGSVGMKDLLPTGKVITVVDGPLEGTLGPSFETEAMRLVSAYLSDDMSYSSFSSQWQSMLVAAAHQWAAANHVNLAKYK